MTAKEFLYGLPDKVPSDAIKGHEVTFHFDFSSDGEGQFTISLANGQIGVSEGLSGDADCMVRGKGEDFVRVCTGDLNPMMAVMTGKLKISDAGLMMRYAKIFGLT